jgi:hypothetical protein
MFDSPESEACLSAKLRSFNENEAVFVIMSATVNDGDY